MKVKRFNNLWAMGLILFGAILVAFYVAKIFFPEFIVGVAEIPQIVKFGNYVDTHKWASLIYHFVVCYIGFYIYCCACCKTYKITFKQNIVIVLFIFIGLIIQEFFIEIYTAYNYTMFILCPTLMLLVEKSLSKETFFSTNICFSIDIMSQSLSLFIRNVVVLANWVNSATLTILLIDTWIWRILLYLFFNYKNKKEI